MTGDEGGVANLSNHFQVANCTSLPYQPKLSLKLSGGVKRRGHPAIKAVFTAKPGEANTRKVSVALPKGELLDNAHIGTICTQAAVRGRGMPGRLDRSATAEATTPLLDQPLKGNVYLRSSNHELPDLVMDLEGPDRRRARRPGRHGKGRRPAHDLRHRPRCPGQLLRAEPGGRRQGPPGQQRKPLRQKAKKATVKMTGQNGAVAQTKTKLQAACGAKARHKRHKRHSDARKAG